MLNKLDLIILVHLALTITLDGIHTISLCDQVIVNPDMQVIAVMKIGEADYYSLFGKLEIDCLILT
jgi:hypothetical protein